MTKMKIEASYKKRQLVSVGNQLYRRLVHEIPALPGLWQEQIHTGEFHNIVDLRACRLEALYLALAPVPLTVDSCGNEIGIRFHHSV